MAGSAIVAIGLAIGLPIMIWPASIGFVVCIASILFFSILQIPELGISSILLLFEQNAVAAAVGAVAVGVLVWLTWQMRRIVPLVSTAVFGVIFLAVILLPPDRIELGTQFERDSGAALEAPPIIHIVLDEHIGIEGIPLDVPGGQDLREEIAAFYRRHGFKLYGGAFSHWAQTQYALGGILNARIVPDGLLRPSEDPRADFILTQNRWFDTLSDQGYKIRVYQTDYLDLCLRDGSQIESCHVSPANSFSLLQATDFPAGQLARVMLENFVETLTIGLGIKAKPKHRLGAMAAQEVLTQIARDLGQAPQGRAVFAHLLIPHQSYIYDAACNIKKNVSEWANSSDANAPDNSANTIRSRRERYIKYFEQVKCTYKLLEEFFQNLQELDIFDSATIILHGDHGARIGLFNPGKGSVGAFSETDVVEYFSTLFAVKTPGVAPSYDPSLVSIQALFSESFLGQNLSDSGPFVFLIGYSPRFDDQPARAPMPDPAARAKSRLLGTSPRISASSRP